MDWETFTQWGRRIAGWSAGYRRTLRERPVRAQTAPGDIAALLPSAPPEAGDGMETIFADFERIVLPGMTHWQHPRFFAYFPANAAPPSVLAEFLTAAIGAQCMLWQTSPAATEMETRMMDWLRQALGLPEGFAGVIQDSASSATLAAVLTMRERALDWAGNKAGLFGRPALRLYGSAEAHSSVERAAWIAGIGGDNLVRLPGDGPGRSIQPDTLSQRIAEDRAAGHVPAGLILCVGATGTGASDEIAPCLSVAKAEGLYTHVDAAWAGTAMICPEFRSIWEGVEGVDSIVFNPHKWLGAQFDCAAHFLADPAPLVRTLAIRPAYLHTHGAGDQIDYSEWSVPLGRRFRALKLWFLIRYYGLDALRARIRNHIAWAGDLAREIAADPRFEIVTEPFLSLFSFRLAGLSDEDQRAYLQRINDDGRIYLTPTLVDGRTVIRFQVGQWETEKADLDAALAVLRELAPAK